jgi:hypothetical protein
MSGKKHSHLKPKTRSRARATGAENEVTAPATNRVPVSVKRGARRTFAGPSPIGERPGSSSYFGEGAPRPNPGTAAHGQQPSAIGEPPGSPAYFGRTEAAQGTQTRKAAGPAPGGPQSSAVGEPPGSPAYFGRGRSGPTTGSAHDSAQPESVGERPGSPAYYGRAGGRRS